jgi:hypothetical protein
MCSKECSADCYSAAEMRAAAAEARLRHSSSSHAGPSSPVKLERMRASPEDDKPDDLDEEDGNGSNRENDVKEEEDVDDPHATAEERRREMEEEMDDDEMEALRGGWEDFVGGANGTKGNKRERSNTPILTSPVKKKQETSIRSEGRSGFGRDMVIEESARALGLASGTLGRSDRRLGTKVIGPVTTTPDSVRSPPSGLLCPSDTAAPHPRGWACALCTYVNLADHGRCGMSLLLQACPSR